MNDKKQKNHLAYSKLKEKGIIDDVNEYGEFIATFDAWLTPEEQKRRAQHIEDLGTEGTR